MWKARFPANHDCCCGGSSEGETVCCGCDPYHRAPGSFLITLPVMSTASPGGVLPCGDVDAGHFQAAYGCDDCAAIAGVYEVTNPVCSGAGCCLGRFFEVDASDPDGGSGGADVFCSYRGLFAIGGSPHCHFALELRIYPPVRGLGTYLPSTYAAPLAIVIQTFLCTRFLEEQYNYWGPFDLTPFIVTDAGPTPSVGTLNCSVLAALSLAYAGTGLSLNPTDCGETCGSPTYPPCTPQGSDKTCKISAN